MASKVIPINESFQDEDMASSDESMNPKEMDLEQALAKFADDLANHADYHQRMANTKRKHKEKVDNATLHIAKVLEAVFKFTKFSDFVISKQEFSINDVELIVEFEAMKDIDDKKFELLQGIFSNKFEGLEACLWNSHSESGNTYGARIAF